MTIYLGNNWDDENDPLAHEGAGAIEELVDDPAAKGHSRT